MDLTGWIYDEIACPIWTKVFGISIEQNPIFGNCPWDELNENLVNCDLVGYINRSGDEWQFFDSLFDFCGINLKACYNTQSKVLMNEKPVFSESFSSMPMLDDDTIKAQFVVIDQRFVYFSMTSYSFWNPIENYIRKKMHSCNLGGWFLDINRYPTIKKFIFEKCNFSSINKCKA